jgi:hypothetical protein
MPKLTDRTVAALTCPAGRKDALHFDEALKGFGVRVTAQARARAENCAARSAMGATR